MDLDLALVATLAVVGRVVVPAAALVVVPAAALVVVPVVVPVAALGAVVTVAEDPFCSGGVRHQKLDSCQSGR